jgi:hypothetical protein
VQSASQCWCTQFIETNADPEFPLVRMFEMLWSSFPIGGDFDDRDVFYPYDFNSYLADMDTIDEEFSRLVAEHRLRMARRHLGPAVPARDFLPWASDPGVWAASPALIDLGQIDVDPVS